MGLDRSREVFVELWIIGQSFEPFLDIPEPSAVLCSAWEAEKPLYVPHTSHVVISTPRWRRALWLLRSVLHSAARTSLLLWICNFWSYWNFYNSFTSMWLRDFVHDMRYKLIHHRFYLWIDLSFTSSRKSHSWNGLIDGWRETFTHGCTVLHEYWQVREFCSLCGWFSSISIIEFRFQSAARPFLSKI